MYIPTAQPLVWIEVKTGDFQLFHNLLNLDVLTGSNRSLFSLHLARMDMPPNSLELAL